MKLLDNVFEIAVLLIGVAIITLLVNPRSNTTQVIGAATSGFNQLLNTITLQTGGMGYNPAGYRG